MSADGAHVLVVDDNPGTTTLLALLLEERGHVVRQAHTGRAAVEAAGEWPPAVVFLDLGLPDIDGYEVARRLRALEGGAGFRIVGLTGYTDSDTAARAAAAGFDDVLLKPTDLDDLVALLERHL